MLQDSFHLTSGELPCIMLDRLYTKHSMGWSQWGPSEKSPHGKLMAGWHAAIAHMGALLGRERERAHVRGSKVGLAGAEVVLEAALVLGQR